VVNKLTHAFNHVADQSHHSLLITCLQVSCVEWSCIQPRCKRCNRQSRGQASCTSWLMQDS